jgi:hypothetical protein
MSIWVELSSPSYIQLAVPNDPGRSSPLDDEVMKLKLLFVRAIKFSAAADIRHQVTP